MSLTLLLDLDDTLLDTNVEEFIPAYFRALSAHLASWVNPEAMLPALMAGTQLMLANADPRLTLQQVFDSAFYPRLGVHKQQLQSAIEQFYDNVFKRLSAVTRRRAGARELVDWAQAQDYRVVVATDPLFPRKAVYERIRWAGLEPERFELISSYEAFHFSKSHPEYYAELLGRLGWPDGPVLMVGNDEERDLARAHEMGIVTYQVQGAAAPVGSHGEVPVGSSSAIGRGSLVDLRRWLESGSFEELEPSLKTRLATTAILRSTPAVLQGLTAGLSPEAWKHEPTPDDWSVVEVVCHLRDTEREVHRTQIETLQTAVQPFVPRPDAAVWAKQRNYLNEDGPRAVEQFAEARLQILGEIEAATPELWEKPARHAIFGPTHFGEVAGFIADHDRLHIQQAWQTLQAAV